jgi:hypothetical protein
MYKPTLRTHTHLEFEQAKAHTKNCKRVWLPNRTETATLDGQPTTEKERRTHNSTYKKLAVQGLNEALCFLLSSVVPDSFRLRNRKFLIAANRYH